jgi:RNA polymerase primary sigma factor
MKNKILDIYQAQIGKYPRLSIDEEKVLAEKIKSGDIQARQRLINCNLRLVFIVARRYEGLLQNFTGISFEDLIQEGNLGLLKAAEQFDGQRNVHFGTYAVAAIKRRIFRTLKTQSRNIRLPDYVTNELIQCNLITDELCQKLSRQPTAEEIAEIMGVSKDKVIMLQNVAQTYNDDNIVMDSDDESAVITFLDTFKDPNAVSIDDKVIDKITRENLTEQINTLLKPSEQRVIKERLGYNNEGAGKTLEEIGEINMGFTRERARQLEKIAVTKLRNFNLKKEHRWQAKIDRVHAADQNK